MALFLQSFLLAFLLTTGVVGRKSSQGSVRSQKQETAIRLDGDVSEWPLIHRAYPKLWEKSTVNNVQIFGMRDQVSGDYLFAINRLDSGTIQQGTTIFLDVDQSSSATTTFGLSESEFYIDFINSNSNNTVGGPVPNLYKTNPWTWIGPVNHAFSTDQKTVELALPAASIGGAARDIDFFVDVNDSLYFPTLFSSNWYVAGSPFLPQPTADRANKRVAIIFSRESEATLYGGGDVNKYVYRKLYASLQHQVMMAGVPFDLIYIDKLKDMENCIKYSALVFSYVAYVNDSDRDIIADNLRLAVHYYGVGIVAGDNFLTNKAGANPAPFANPYRAMWEVLGINILGYGSGNFVIAASNTNHPSMVGYSAGEEILQYTPGFYSHFGAISAPGVFETSSRVTALAEIKTGSHTHNAVLAIETISGARHVHFATLNSMVDANLMWQALRWVVYGNTTPVGLQLSRHKSVFSARNDVDLSMFPGEVPGRIVPLFQNYMKPWKQKYNFVGSYFINIGNNQSKGEYTNWSVSGPLYKEFIKEENEIGSHTYTHPYYIFQLTEAQLSFELTGSGSVLQAQLGLQDVGYAQPGNPETLSVVNYCENVLRLYYLSGTYTGRGIGFPSAYGFLSPDSTMGFMAPNMFSDFNLLGFKKLSPDQAFAVWTEQFKQIQSHANTPVVHYHWHDYGPFDYNPTIFENTIKMAHSDNSEFITNKELFERMKRMKEHGLVVREEVGGLVTATVSGSGSVGQLALDVSSSIESVDNWYAYSRNKVFLPSTGGTFRIKKGSPNTKITRIVSLPMRAELLSVDGNGSGLTFSFIGNGTVTVELNADVANNLVGSGATSIKQVTTTTLEMTFTSAEKVKHTGTITSKRR